MGDHVRLVTLEATIREIKDKELVTKTKAAGEVLLKGLHSLAVRTLYCTYMYMLVDVLLVVNPNSQCNTYIIDDHKGKSVGHDTQEATFCYVFH